MCALLSLATFTIPQHVEATVNLSVTPVTGGNDLRFGRVNASRIENKEVKIRITSTDNRQYQLFHRMLEPLVNTQGENIGHDTLKTYTLIGSNSFGTLYSQDLESIGFGDQLLYSSSASGESDTFRVVYSVQGDQLKASGNFSGQILYTVRPIGGGAQDTIFLNVFLESSGELKVNVEGSTGQNTVHLSYPGEFEKTGHIKISFNGNLGRKIKIYQKLEVFPKNDQLDEINKSAVNIQTSGNQNGNVFVQNPSPLERKRILLYESNQNEDTFFVNFFLDEQEIKNQKAGHYNGNLTYIIESADGIQEYRSMIEIEVAPVFNLEVKLPPGGMDFSKMLPKSPPQIKEIMVEVETNLGKPYIVVQNVTAPLSNEKGELFSEDVFTLKGESVGAEIGKMISSEFTPVSNGETPIYFSDEKGSSAKFKIHYRMRPDQNMNPGDFATSIVYSLQEM